MNGKFIVIDGNDGTGKTTLISNLKKKLNSEKFIFVKDPGQTPLGEKIRTLLLDIESKICPISELFLFTASRAQLVNDIIKPALKTKNVISDRYILSTLVYQDGVKDLGDFNSVINFGLKDCQPDLIILLDVPSEISISRISKTRTKDRMESVNDNIVSERRNKYLEYAEKMNNVIRVDSTISEDLLLEKVLSLIEDVTNDNSRAN